MSVISWGRRERVAFSSCGALESWAPPQVPAVYAVTYQRDPQTKPKAHTVLYFGEAESLSASQIKSKVSEIWSREGGEMSDLFIFIHPMESSTRVERSRVLQSLIMEYLPQGNRYSD